MRHNEKIEEFNNGRSGFKHYKVLPGSGTVGKLHNIQTLKSLIYSGHDYN